MARNINRVIVVGNLTRDPELRHTPSGMAVCSLRIAVNTTRKDETGQWVDKPNYFDVTVWDKQGENCAQYLAKGRPVAIDGRLEWREWEQDGNKRQAVEIVADNVQFLGGRQDSEGGAPAYVPAGAASSGDDFPASPADDDIPF
jgi:single-strand DNA-binding protein